MACHKALNKTAVSASRGKAKAKVSQPPAPPRKKLATPGARKRELKDMKFLGDGCRHGLKIGVVKFPATAGDRTGNMIVPAFIHDPLAPTAEEVFTSLDFLLKLRLFHPKEATKANDSIMRDIALKGDTNMDKKNTVTKANSNFAHNFVEILSFNIAYNEFFYRSKMPKSVAKLPPPKNVTEAIRLNAKVIHNVLYQRDKKITKLLFPEGIKNICTNPSAIIGVRNVLVQKAMNAIRFGYSGSPTKSLWVHQLFLLSTIHPRLNLNVVPNLVDDLDGTAPGWKRFIAVKELQSGRKAFCWKGQNIGEGAIVGAMM
jgi:hypothetical protein